MDCIYRHHRCGYSEWTRTSHRTYLGAKVKHIGKHTVTVRQGDYILTTKLLAKNTHPLLAQDHGNMSRTIHESASCKACYRFSHKGQTLCEFTSDRASFEFEYQ